MIYSKKGLSTILLTLIIFIFAGCATPPKPINISLQRGSENITDDERKYILEMAIKKSYQEGQHRKKRKVRLSSNSIRLSVRYKSSSIVFDYEFKFYANYTKLAMIDNSYGNEEQSPYALPYGMYDYMGLFQKNLMKNYNNIIQDFSIFKIIYLKNEEKFESKYSDISFKIIDNTDTLTNNQLKNIDIFTTEKIPNNALAAFKQTTDLNKIPSLFVIDSSIDNRNSRYKYTFKTRQLKGAYTTFDDENYFEIDSMQYNFIPNTFISQDDNIRVEIINIPLQRKVIQTFKISNNTKSFIELKTVAGYYGEDVIDGLSSEAIKIAPMSKKTIQMIDFPKDKFQDVYSRTESVQYGFSVSYKVMNTGETKNLYKVNKYLLNEFYD